MLYSDIQHTKDITLRTFLKIYKSDAIDKTGPIYSEGAYRIGLLLSRDIDTTWECKIKIGDEEFYLTSPDLSGIGRANIVDPRYIFWFDGNVNTIRDDEFTYTFEVVGEEEMGVAYLYVFFDRVGWRKQDNLYPAVIDKQ